MKDSSWKIALIYNSSSMALQPCLQLPPSIAIVSCDIPDASGINIAEALRTSGEFQIIVLAGHGDDEIARAAEDAGGNSLLRQAHLPGQADSDRPHRIAEVLGAQSLA